MPSDVPGEGVRQGDDRRHAERRHDARSEGERRVDDRRRRAAGGLLLGMMALGGGLSQARRAPSGPPYTQATDEVSGAGLTQTTPPPKDRMYDDIILEAAATYDVDPELIRAVIRTESGFDAAATSPAGAQGLMQLMPFLSKELGVKDPLDPRDNIFGGVRYLSKLLSCQEGNVALAVASYNAGPRAVKRYRGIPPYKETRGYVKKIKGLLADAQVADASLSPQAALSD